MIYEITWIENKTTKTGKPYKATIIKDDQGKETDVNIWSDFPNFGNLIPGSKIDVMLEQNGQYWNIKSNIINRKPNMDRIVEKKASFISEAQNRKAESIALAQDKSSWMWAKNNAVELLKGGEWTLEKINELATDIYNMQPTKPF